MKKIFVLLSLIFLNGQNAYADPDENAPSADKEGFRFGLTEEMMFAQTEKNDSFQKDLQDRISLIDINSDGVISETEIKEMIKGLDVFSGFSEKEKKEMAEMAERIFKESDADHDRLLNETETKTFAKNFNIAMMKMEFKKRDLNGDGIIDLKDIPPIEDSMKKLDDAMKRLDDLSKKLDEMDPDEMAQNFLKNTTTAISKEDFYRMDKDNNGCVTANEYADYELKQQQKMSAEENKEEKEKNAPYRMTREDFLSLYAEAKKSKPDCMTMDEYIAQQESFLDVGQIKTTEQREKEFALMDANKDGRLTAEEFAAFKTAANPDSTVTEEDYIDIFNIAPKMEWDISAKGEKKDYLTKEDFDQHADFLDFLISSVPDAKKEKTMKQRYTEFDLMDANKNGRVTAEEFATYKKEADPDSKMTKEDYIEMFNLSAEARKKGYLTKPEFVLKAYLFDLLQSFSSEP